MMKICDTYAVTGQKSQYTKITVAFDPLPLGTINGLTGAILAAEMKLKYIQVMAHVKAEHKRGPAPPNDLERLLQKRLKGFRRS